MAMPGGTRVCISIFLITLLTVCKTRACPSVCQCANTKADCSSRNLTTVPTGWPQGVANIDLSNNSIKQINNRSFQGFLSSLRRLDLSRNKLRTIPGQSFIYLSALKYVTIDRNELVVLPDNVFKGLDLIELSFSHNNRLREVSPLVFGGSRIRTLKMDGCNMTSLPVDLFQPLRGSLSRLYLSHNQIALDLPFSIFQGIKLETLTLNHNGIRQTSFLRNTGATEVYLNVNPLNFSTFEDMTYSNIQSLHFANAGFTKLAIPRSADRIQALDVSSNRISSVKWESLRNLKNLVTLNMKNNSLWVFPHSVGTLLPALKILILDQNRITGIGFESLQLGNITHLDLRNNKIQTIEPKLKYVLRKLRLLYLQDNPFHCNCEMRWFYWWIKTLRYGDTKVFLNYCHSPKMAPLLDLRDSDFACRKPKIVGRSADRKVKLGTAVTIVVSVEGDPTPAILCTLPEGGAISTGPPLNMTKNRNSITWEVQQFSCSQVGVYNCTASNLVGNSTVNIDIKVTPADACGSGEKVNVTTKPMTSRVNVSAGKAAAIITSVIAVTVLLVIIVIVVFHRQGKYQNDYRLRQKKKDIRRNDENPQTYRENTASHL